MESAVTRVRIAFQLVPEPKTTKNRIHLDVEVDSIDFERERLVGLGAEGTVALAERRVG